MLRDFTWTEKYEEAMPDGHPPYLMTIKNAKKILKLTKNIIYVASSNKHSLATDQ